MYPARVLGISSPILLSGLMVLNIVIIVLTTQLGLIQNISCNKDTVVVVNTVYTNSGLDHESQPQLNSNNISKRLALVMYGILDHNSGADTQYKPPSPEISLNATFDRLNRYIIEPAKRMGYEVDIFCHSWDVDYRNLILKTYRPALFRFEKGGGPYPKMGAFQSIEAGLELRKEFEQQHSFSYDWVLPMRYDIYFRNEFEFDKLNPSLFYIANWCYPTRNNTQSIWPTKEGDLFCQEMEAFEEDSWDGIPDFWYLGSSESVDTVFVNLTSDLNAGAFEKSASCCHHGVSGGRVFDLHDKGLINIGRYKVHAWDYNIFRNLDPNIDHLAELHLDWKVSNDHAHNVYSSHRASVCSGTYCVKHGY